MCQNVSGINCGRYVRFGFNSGHISLNQVNVCFRAESHNYPVPILKTQAAMSALTNSGHPNSLNQAESDVRLRPVAHSQIPGKFR
jgi:hypothetical protein